jgi:DNA-directed DNA polymerase
LFTGITSFGLSQQLGITRKEAQEYIDSYLEKYSGIKEYMDKQIRFAEDNGFVTTLFGRKRFISELKSKNYMVREFGKRVAMNSPIQGTAADIMKIAMIKCYNELKNSGIDAKIVLQVHDELLIEASKSDLDKAIEILRDSMENAVKISIPLKVEIQTAYDWYSAK